MKCTECKGKKYIELFQSRPDCDHCGATGVEPEKKQLLVDVSAEIERVDTEPFDVPDTLEMVFGGDDFYD